MHMKHNFAKTPLAGDRLKNRARALGYMLLANTCYALALNLFLIGNNIAAGGFSGIGIIVNYIVPFPVGLFTLALNLPFFIWGLFVKDRGYMLTTILSAAVLSAATDALSFLPTVTDNRLFAAVCAGLLYGVGAVLMLKAGCSEGGTDLVAKLLVTRFRHLSLGTMFIVVDGLIVLSSMVVFRSFESGLYAAVTILVYSYSTDVIIHGANRASIFYIITDRPPEPLAQAIMQAMNRGVTLQHATGMFAHSQRNVLMAVVKPREVYRIKDIVRGIDPNAFVILTSANEVMGHGFSDMEVDSSRQKEWAIARAANQKQTQSEEQSE